MSYFTKIDNLPTLDLYHEFQIMMQCRSISWSRDNQICINTIKEKPDDYLLGSGSLTHDWSNSVVDRDEYGNEKISVQEIASSRQLKETDFNTICDQFIGTEFEKVYNALNDRYVIGRVRIMKLRSKTCLSWHVDLTRRLHYPMKTHKGCFMIINDELKHLPEGEWWMADTLPEHTAINSGKEDRLHLVAAIVSERL